HAAVLRRDAAQRPQHGQDLGAARTHHPHTSAGTKHRRLRAGGRATPPAATDQNHWGEVLVPNGSGRDLRRARIPNTNATAVASAPVSVGWARHQSTTLPASS